MTASQQTTLANVDCNWAAAVFFRAFLIAQGLEAETYGIDMIKTKRLVRIGLEISLVSPLRAALVRSQD